MKSGAHASPSVAPATIPPPPTEPSASASSASSASSSSSASSAPSSLSSLWLDTASQSSDDSSFSAHTSDADSCDAPSSRNASDLNHHSPPPARLSIRPCPRIQEPFFDSRPNPRRCGLASHFRSAPPPALVRQSDRKVNFVDSLVDSSTQIVEAIWPLSSTPCPSGTGSKAVLPLRTFIQETLRRSRTSYSTLQVALYYLILVKPRVTRRPASPDQHDLSTPDRSLQCGRRMFLVSLILASKYLQDRNYSARAWSKISGLNTQEINRNEIAFLLAVNWKLHIADDVFQRWTEIILRYTPSQPPPPPPSASSRPPSSSRPVDWKEFILELSPDLANADGLFAAVAPTGSASELSVPLLRHSPAASTETGHLPASSQDGAKEAPTPRPCSDPPPPPPPLHPLNHSPAASAGPSVSTTVAAMTPVSALNKTTHHLGRSATTLGMLPTPTLPPQTGAFCTPAASAALQPLTKADVLGLPAGQGGAALAPQGPDRFYCRTTSPPQGHAFIRRPSLTASNSTTSSPESMVSDLSWTSSASSNSSLISASSHNSSTRCGQPSLRLRAARPWNDRFSAKTNLSWRLEDQRAAPCSTSSPDSVCAGPVANLCRLSLDTPLGRWGRDADDKRPDLALDAARALQHLHKDDGALVSSDAMPAAARTGCKRSRTASLESWQPGLIGNSLDGDKSSPGGAAWADGLVGGLPEPLHRSTDGSRKGSGGKRVCCPAEMTSSFGAIATTATGRGAIDLTGSGLWHGILN